MPAVTVRVMIHQYIYVPGVRANWASCVTPRGPCSRGDRGGGRGFSTTPNRGGGHNNGIPPAGGRYGLLPLHATPRGGSQEGTVTATVEGTGVGKESPLLVRQAEDLYDLRDMVFVFSSSDARVAYQANQVQR